MTNLQPQLTLRRQLSCRLRTLHSTSLSHWLARRSRELVPNQRSAMVFSPHQDDETLGCGGLIALKRAASVPVQVIFLTDGSQSFSVLPCEALIALRKQEATEALGLLGVTPEAIHFLDIPDTTLRSLPPSEREALIAQIQRLLQEHRPEEVFVPHRQDRHYLGDHEATYSLVKEAVADSGLTIDVWQYPIWLFWEAFALVDLKPAELIGAYRLSIDGVCERKQAAIAVYRSQIFPPGALRRFAAPYEIFFKISVR